MPHPLESVQEKDYISKLDNPYVTAQMAFDYFTNQRTLESIEKEVRELMEANEFIPLINDETVHMRLEELYGYLITLGVKEIEEEMVSTVNVFRFFFKMALPQHRLNSDNDTELKLCLNMLDPFNFKNLSSVVIDYSNLNPFTKDGQLVVQTYAKTICWTGSNVGQSFVKGLII